MKICFNEDEKNLNFEMILGVFDPKTGKFLESAHQEVSKTVDWDIQVWREVLNFERKTCVWP